MIKKQNKLIVVLGPTACGKTKIAVRLAVKYNGEIISADSRQVYRGMDIGTGKDLADYRIGHRAVPYHLIDVLSPKIAFNAASYQRLAYDAIDEVLGRQRQPFLVGGTGLYIDAVTQGFAFDRGQKSKVKSKNLRKKLDRLTLAQLLLKLQKIDQATYEIIDKNNRRRVQRALEIYYETGQRKSELAQNQAPDFGILYLGIKFSLSKIYQRIDERLEARLKAGMITEVKVLRRRGLSWKKLEEFGLEYRYVAQYVRGKISYEDLLVELKRAIHHFARRQLTWFRRNEKIIWVESFSQADKLVKKFLN